ncbi:MAG: hypothetical protein JW844_06065 [Candidatus Omnitrophica bacterium]|nr:hypothetical protein [Candidatus Omnitrophota bacterium]
MFKRIIEELKHHAPFTFFGALTGIILMAVFRTIPHGVAHRLFFTFHPLHVLLSALTTAAMYQRHKCGANRKQCNLFFLLMIGYVGSIGIATVSDSLMPYAGEALLDMPRRGVHIGFIEMWWLVNPMAVVGIAIAYFKPTTKFPHYGHVLLSTWASLFHILMAAGGQISLMEYGAVFLFLFLAVWLPCCISDIVFPLLFVGEVPESHDTKSSRHMSPVT